MRAGNLALSADRSTVYFETTAGGADQIYRLPVTGSASPTLVANGYHPALSPDGAELAYGVTAGNSQFGPNEVVVRDLRSGSERVAVTAPPPQAQQYLTINRLSWAPDNRHLVASIGGESYRATTVKVFDTRHPQQVSEPSPDQPTYRISPTYLPDGSLFLVEATYPSAATNPSQEQMAVVDPVSGRTRRVVATGPFNSDLWTATDTTGQHLLFVISSASGSRLMISDDGAAPTVLAGVPNIAAAAW